MNLIPAIDLKDGNCVRLFQGEMSRSTIFSSDPPAQARAFQEAGCSRLHIVDLNAAVEGRPVNADTVDQIREAVDIAIQLGGGIRTFPDIEYWLESGIDRVILGTVAAEEPDLVRSAARWYPGRIAVGIDAADGLVATRGWVERTDLPAVDVARRFEDCGVAAVIYTDIAKDGAMTGPNIAATKAIARAVRIPVIASGGISGISDLEAIRQRAPELAGVIVGRALYEKSFSLREALRVVEQNGMQLA